MFVLLATKPLNDDTKGFRFNILGIKGLTRKRIHKTRYGITKGQCMKAYHLGKRSVYIETKGNRNTTRQFKHFAGQSMSDKETKGTAKVVPIDQYYYDLSRIIDDADWMGDDETVALYLPEKEQIKQQMNDGELWYPNF